ncbi:flavin reductase (DIM6/NTAB) family NADH-FMN oxidoreductase RutF [Actinoplanes octamycinicus]|uniref:Flavin reductase (DIM6/NTAB) family NADH-FMN oxidoreductase RutF n=1 Tax=Actinoplanes octamycinicus TaxID=135948 RepID=A0A7W7M983_9ACTN|nr:flavin reductase family protein [Actinoplanes octamycinicus]MBB4741556.1 flavin reductase (DIM6/NTAB) family NADH-FMN oxidoreductase RutF [Actinoplanes octamycinicus]GIE57108.1 flavin-dependent reductase [Actinoplanes octamycinicus]
MTVLTSAPIASAPVDATLFRQVFRRHAAGVAVVTTDAGHGPAGVTVTSLASLSAEPPLLSFSITATASTWPHLRDAETAVVHLLGAGHTELARTFATSGIDRFGAPTRWRRLPTGEPVLDDAAAWLRIAIEHRHPAGGSHLVIGRVEEAGLAEPGAPLLYHDGTFHAL